MEKDYWRLLRLFFVLKSISLLIAIICALLLEPYDKKTDLLLSNSESKGAFDSAVKTALAPFARWDALYFLTIAGNGYSFEHQHAFFPLYPILMKALSFLLPFLSLHSKLLISGLVISNSSHLISSLLVFE